MRVWLVVHIPIACSLEQVRRLPFGTIRRGRFDQISVFRRSIMGMRN